jgi:cytochrome c peroxidase
MSPESLPPPPPDPSNSKADDPRAAALGQKLFFDPLLSGKLLHEANDGSPGTLGTKGQAGKIACIACHDPDRDFIDTRSPGKQASLGASWGRRRSPSLLDVGRIQLLGWDGRRDTVFGMTLGAIESPVDMNGSRLHTAQQIFQRYKAEYEAVFGPLPALGAAPFPQVSASDNGCATTTSFTPNPTCNGIPIGQPGDPKYDALSYANQIAVTRVAVNVGKAIGAYLRLLTCGPSRFDQWMRGQEDALTLSEQRGAKVFVGRGECASCHFGPYLTDQTFHNVGLALQPGTTGSPDPNDEGVGTGIMQAIGDPLNVDGIYSDGKDNRLPEAVPERARGAFLTPRLRCSSRRPSFMHTGQLATMSSVIEFFNRGGDPGGYPGKNELHPLALSPSEVTDLEAFMRALDGPGPAEALRRRPNP